MTSLRRKMARVAGRPACGAKARVVTRAKATSSAAAARAAPPLPLPRAASAPTAPHEPAAQNKAQWTRHAHAARAASLRRKKAQVLARATAPSTGRRHARPHHCHERRARPPPGRGTSRRGLRVPGPPQRARARADRCRLRRALASSSARGPAAASDGWRGLRMLAARRDQLSKRTDVRDGRAPLAGRRSSVVAHRWSRRPRALHAVVHLTRARWPPASRARASMGQCARMVVARAVVALGRAFMQLSGRSGRPVGHRSAGRGRSTSKDEEAINRHWLLGLKPSTKGW